MQETAKITWKEVKSISDQTQEHDQEEVTMGEKDYEEEDYEEELITQWSKNVYMNTNSDKPQLNHTTAFKRKSISKTSKYPPKRNQTAARPKKKRKSNYQAKKYQRKKPIILNQRSRKKQKRDVEVSKDKDQQTTITTSSSEEEEPPTDYASWSYQELRLELKKRGVLGTVKSQGKMPLVRIMRDLLDNKNSEQHGSSSTGRKQEPAVPKVYGMDIGQTNPICVARTRNPQETNSLKSPKVLRLICFFVLIQF